MKKISAIAIAALALFASCEPICEQYDLGESITAEQLKAASSVTVVKEDGVNINYIKCNSTAKALTSWFNGVEVKPSAYAEFKMLFLGELTATVTAFNPDGTTVSVDFPVNIEKYSDKYPVEPQWGILFGKGEKVWGWNTVDTDKANGKSYFWGGYTPAGPDVDAAADGAGWWWGWAPEEINDPDGGNSVMTFNIAGSKIIKDSGTGTVKFDMTPTSESNIGTITTTGAGILYPYIEDDDCAGQKGAKTETFEILRLNDDEMVLCAAAAGTDAWGRSTYWRFRAK